MKRQPHVCKNEFSGEGARGGCLIEVAPSAMVEHAELRVGWSCVIVHDGTIPITWLSEVIAIASGHKDGIGGFLRDHNYGGGYALKCDPYTTQLPHNKTRSEHSGTSS